MPGGPVTHNYSWQLPLLGGDPTVWGQELNTVLGQVDAVVFNNNFAITTQLTSSALVLTKAVTVAANVVYNGVIGTNKLRWAVGVDGLTESGSNANSNFHFQAYDDNGVSLGSAITIARATQIVTFPQNVSVGGAITVTGISAFNAVAVNSTLGVTGAVTASSTVTATGAITSNASIAAGANITAGINIGAAGDVTAGANIVATGNITAANVTATSNITATNSITASGSFKGPDTGGAACLLDSTGANTWSFRWDGTWGYYRINRGAAEITIATGQARNLNYVAGGGPIGVVLNGTSSGGVLYGTYCDAACDERIKENIRPSSVDALQVVNAIQIDEFDIRASVAGWFEATNEPSREERARFMREARPRHVPIGVVAQKLQALIPEAVYASPQDDPPDDSPLPPNMLTLADAALTPYLLRAIQQLTERIQALEAKLAA